MFEVTRHYKIFTDQNSHFFISCNEFLISVILFHSIHFHRKTKLINCNFLTIFLNVLPLGWLV